MDLKLYRIKTVLKYIPESWRNAAFIKDKSDRSRISAFVSLLYWYYFYGHDFNDYCTFRFWEKSSEEKKSYISLRRNDKLRFALSTPAVYKTLLDKAEFNKCYSKYVVRKWLDCRVASDMEILQFAKSFPRVVAKPIGDYGGHGVLVVNGGDLTITPPSMLRKEGYILEECIENVDSIKRIAPASLNTIRIVTLIDKDGKLHILAALLRMGNGKDHTDNYHAGGMACPIDVNTGKLFGKAYGMECAEYEVHPLSNIKFDGYEVEGFDDCVSMVYDIASVVPDARYVGWDFAVTPTGIELLEGNIPPGEDITQIAAGRGLWNEIIEKI